MSDTTDIVIAGAARTPVGSFGGGLSSLPAHELGKVAIDAAIERAVKTWWGDFRYPEWWKAQLWQESRLDPSAVSPAGARGIAQFMPATWRDVVARLDLPRGADPHEARFAIDAGAYYMASLRRAWYAKRSALLAWRE